MIKRINCKDGLTNKEELEARKLRKKLENGDKEQISEIWTLYKVWYKSPKEGFLEWLNKSGYKILYSALKRMGDWTKILY